MTENELDQMWIDYHKRLKDIPRSDVSSQIELIIKDGGWSMTMAERLYINYCIRVPNHQLLLKCSDFPYGWNGFYTNEQHPEYYLKVCVKPRLTCFNWGTGSSYSYNAHRSVFIPWSSKSHKE
ncbi:hypothetical protein UFOVP9_34 [uncultured Caudovirales phage]|jgi:hypothetical protein|uniref:Uncharacterized protein n=1 Tax=uncultured Caudovirales phage TaxID=2100421 RepID=A0A6J5KLN6_9CAUD|nr:hypothetical protein UFOVP9_34 [uncultured Caudovirales phage]